MSRTYLHRQKLWEEAGPQLLAAKRVQHVRAHVVDLVLHTESHEQRRAPNMSPTPPPPGTPGTHKCAENARLTWSWPNRAMPCELSLTHTHQAHR